MTTIRSILIATVFVVMTSSFASAKTLDIFSENTADNIPVDVKIICTIPDDMIVVNVQEFIITSVYRTDVDKWLNSMDSFSDGNCFVNYDTKNPKPFPGADLDSGLDFDEEFEAPKPKKVKKAIIINTNHSYSRSEDNVEDF